MFNKIIMNYVIKRPYVQLLLEQHEEINLLALPELFKIPTIERTPTRNLTTRK